MTPQQPNPDDSPDRQVLSPARPRFACDGEDKKNLSRYARKGLFLPGEAFFVCARDTRRRSS